MNGLNRQNKQLPPGPPKIPVIGNMHQLGALPHQSLWQLSKKYGPVMFLQFGSQPTIVVSSAAAAKEVLKIHDLECCSRPPLVSYGIPYNYLDMGFAPYGEYWREMRKTCVLELFNTKRVESFELIREEEVALLIKSIYQSSLSAAPIDLGEKLFSLTASIICRIAFGKSFRGSEIDNNRLQDMIHGSQAMLASFSAPYFFQKVNWIRNKLTGVQERLEKSFNDLDAFFKHVIDEHLHCERSKQEQEGDIIDVLLKMERDQMKFGEDQITKEHIRAMQMNIFLAGVETSAMSMIWAMTELARNPRVMKKAQDEVRSYVGNKGKVTQSDTDNLEYLKNIVKETLRLHPPSPLLLPRQAMSHFKLHGYDVFPETRIEVNVWAIGRDPVFWENPEEFFPERFSDGSIDFKGQHFEFLPFGAGRRGCPGIYMGTTILELTLANLLCCFDWKLPDGMKEKQVDTEEAIGLTIFKRSALKLVPIKYHIFDKEKSTDLF